MKKSDLLDIIDQSLLDRLFGFCYNRTSDSHAAQSLCSDIVFALVKAGNTEGEIDTAEGFIWRVAHNVYADFSKRRKTDNAHSFAGDPETIFAALADEEDVTPDQTDAEQMQSILRRIAFLSRAYREVMIAFYLDGKSVAQIAAEQGASETAIKQRLYSARNTIKKELNTMEKTMNKPVALDRIDYIIWGTGSPGTGDPRELGERQLSNHILWLCRNKPMSAAEISDALDVPMMYIEEELEIQARGMNGYGFLKKCDSGKYTTNFVLLDVDEIKAMQQLYVDRIPAICDTVAKYIEDSKEKFLSFPFLNKRVDLNLILWGKIHSISHILSDSISEKLKDLQFADVTPAARPFFVFGYRDFGGTHWGGGCDGIGAKNVCGYSRILLDNIYISRIKKHFSCGHNIANDPCLMLAIRTVDGLDVATLSDDEKEVAAKAIAEGYLYREGDTLYTKILTMRLEDMRAWNSLDADLAERFGEEIEAIAAEIATLIRQALPEHLLPEYRLANALAGQPVLDTLVESLIKRGILTPPEDGLGAEGCYMFLQK